MPRKTKRRNGLREISEDLWNLIEPILPSDKPRRDRGEFFLQPHWTEVVWGGQKVLCIFQHHSRQFVFYYELQTSELSRNAESFTPLFS